MEPSFNIEVKSAKSRKKKRGGALENNIDNKKFTTEFKTGDTTEFDSVNMEKKCLVEKTSFDHREGGTFAGRNSNQTLKNSKIQTKRALSKSLEKINFLSNDNNDILLDEPVVLLPSLKNLVNVFVYKSFALDIGLDKVVGKSSQKKCTVVRKLFSRINGFGEVSTSLKFSRIIQATFTSELDLIKATEKTIGAKIIVNTNFKKSTG
ncbi:hypothetical protein G9A89_019024 [Geosiphon pyriformis]|nr:hypothetical protein G9A89_019024 [Geosiphon pyriformis]